MVRYSEQKDQKEVLLSCSNSIIDLRVTRISKLVLTHKALLGARVGMGLG
jgi:hypothetical protein